jgi:hypothetical protein
MTKIREEFQQIEFSKLGRAKSRKLALAFTQLTEIIEQDSQADSNEVLTAVSKLQEAYHWSLLALAKDQKNRMHIV